MATKQEEKRKEALAAATELFEGMTQEQANAYFTENLMITQITKAHMAAKLSEAPKNAAVTRVFGLSFRKMYQFVYHKFA